MRRPFPAVALVYAGGVLAGNALFTPLAWLFALSLLMVLSALILVRARYFLLWPLLFITGWTNLSSRTQVLSPDDLRTEVGTDVAIVAVRGTLIDTPVERVFTRNGKQGRRTLARIRVTSLQAIPEWRRALGQITVSTRGSLPADYFSGRVVEVIGVISPPKGPAAEGLFDYAAYLRQLGIYHQLDVESAAEWRLVDRGSLARPPLADRFRAWAQKTLARGLPEEDESLRLLWAMALGWTTALTGEVSEPFMQTGTMHIFAISGLHIALIAGILVAVLRVFRISRGYCGWVVIPLIWFYTGATGWQASAIRSTIMMTVIIVGWTLKRPSDLLNSLSAAAFIILLWDPQQLFQAGFQLSFLVVLSIALLHAPLEALRQRLLRNDPFLPPELRPRWRRWLDGPIHLVTVSLATSLAAWLGSLPLIAYYFHLFTPVSLLANLIIVPLSSLALACNLGSLLTAWWPWVNELFNFSGWFWMQAMVEISDWFAALSGAYLYVGAPSWIGFVAYYTLLFGTMTGWLYAPPRRIWTVAGFGVFGVLGFVHWMNRPADTHLTVLALRGGDSMFVNEPGTANDLLIDCGNESAAELVVKPFLRAQGVNRIPRLLLTHGDLRHVAGARLVKQQFSVTQLLTSSVPFRSETYRAILNDSDRSSNGHIEINRGDHVGNWTVLHPAKDDHFPDADDNALVLHGTFGDVSILLCSDLGLAGQGTLLEREPELRADVIVSGIPSHSEPLGDALLDRVQPRVIIVSASEIPPQERARSELRERLERRGIPVFYSSDDGAVTITSRSEGWEVRAMSGKQFPTLDK